jgi:hypothetical protein
MRTEKKNLTVRAPLDVVDWLNKQTERNASSQSSEIVRMIRDKIDAEREAERQVR